MEISAFAEQVLFSTSLEDKLRPPPDLLTDERPGLAGLTPAGPGRPTGLHFKPAGREGRTSDFPDARRLEHAHERGRLLHFFANHELLATELMALALLRFPAAPAAFRRGVLRTLADEQRHTRWYLERMQACGVTFGELPVSGYFWRCVAPMENPIDYVSGLSLTFEQANLDFARHFAGEFGAVGDAATAALLDRIYQDEIGHVAYGLKWFRRWKNPSESDWDAFCRQLQFPLSPQRAKGFAFNGTGRRLAGFDPGFIAELEVFVQSKGRTPGVFVFNPFTEACIARGVGFSPVLHQRRLAEDLATLPQFLCRPDDLVLVPRRPRVEFLRELQQAGFRLPEFVEWPVDCRTVPAALTARKLGGLHPWAWGPDSVRQFSPLATNLPAAAPPLDTCFNGKIAPLYAKSWSAEFLRRFLAARAPEPWLCALAEVGVTAHDPATALAAVAAIRARGHHRVVIKESLGVAGGNALRLWEPAITDAQQRWLARACTQGRSVVVEPWLERVIDFSVQLEMAPPGLRVVGYAGLVNDARGQFHANWAEPNHARRVPTAVIAAFDHAPRDIAIRLKQLYAEMVPRLEDELRTAGFFGPLGIDALVYRDADGAPRLKPVVEINPRYTMGRVTLDLMARAAPGTFGVFRLVRLAQVRQAGAPDFSAYARDLAVRHPLQFEGDSRRRIREGCLCLNDPATAQVCLATFAVSRQTPWCESNG